MELKKFNSAPPFGLGLKKPVLRMACPPDREVETWGPKPGGLKPQPV